jgi:hypothetical protein
MHAPQFDGPVALLLLAGTIIITTPGGVVAQELLIDDVNVTELVEFTLCVNV